MEKMLTLTQDQFASLLKRELTTPAPGAAPPDPPTPSDHERTDEERAVLLRGLPKREAYRYATVRISSCACPPMQRGVTVYMCLCVPA
jgi:hypothetical protein